MPLWAIGFLGAVILVGLVVNLRSAAQEHRRGQRRHTSDGGDGVDGATSSYDSTTSHRHWSDDAGDGDGGGDTGGDSGGGGGDGGGGGGGGD